MARATPPSRFSSYLRRKGFRDLAKTNSLGRPRAMRIWNRRPGSRTQLYTQEKFTDGAARYDLILDIIGNHSLSDTRRVLKPHGILVMVGGPKENRWIGPPGRNLDAIVLGLFVEQEFVSFVSNVTTGQTSAPLQISCARGR